MRTLRLSQMNDILYQCYTPGCSPSTQIIISTLRRCQLACIGNQNCRTATYFQSNQTCRLYPDIPSQFGIIMAATGVITLLAIDERQLTAPMSTTTTTTTTTSTTSTSSTTSSSSTTSTTTSSTTSTTTTATSTTSTTSTTPGTTSLMASVLCYSYTTIDDPTRNVNYYVSATCDSGLFSSNYTWVRFIGTGGTQIPTYQLVGSQCNTHAAGYYTGSMPSTNAIVMGNVCFAYSGSACYNSPVSIYVINCGSYYVYGLSPVPGCSYRYCTV